MANKQYLYVLHFIYKAFLHLLSNLINETKLWDMLELGDVARAQVFHKQEFSS